MAKKKKAKNKTRLPENMRSRAERLVAKKKIKDILKMNENDVHALAHELQVHQIELEMQNEELKRANEKVDDALTRYTHLYEFAPVGYFDLDRQGVIMQANLVGAALLGVERCGLVFKRLQQFIKPDDIPRFNTFCQQAFENGTKQTCEVELAKHDASSGYLRLEGTVTENQKTALCRTAVTDITAFKQAEQKIHLLHTLSSALSMEQSLHSVLTILLRRMCELAGWIYGEIWIPSPDGTHLVYGQAWHARLDLLKEFLERRKEFTFLPGIGLPGRAWITKQPAWINDVTLDPHYLSTTIANVLGLTDAVNAEIKSAVAFPLMAGEEVVAVVVSYLFKPLEQDEHLVNLMSSISTHLGWVIKRKQKDEKIQHMAYNDVLTALPNRLQFKDRLTLELYHAKRHKEMLAVMFVDLDRFKDINDTLGHAVGDQILQCMAKRLKSCIREMDTVSRFGGDEFTLVLPKIGGTKDAAMLAGKIIEAIRQPMTIGNSEIITTTSVGIALFPVDGEDVETLMYQADTAMYRAKEAGKNNYQFAVGKRTEKLSL